MANNTLLYGFQTMSEDVLNTRAAEVPEVQAAIDLSLAAHNAAVNDIIDTFCMRTTQYSAQFENNAGGVLQPLDEFGRSTPRKTSKYSVGWPIQMGGEATGMTWLVEPRTSVLQLNALLSQKYMADIRWIYRKILGALFDTTGATFVDPEYGSISCYGLANSDTVTYYKASSDTSATDNHYLATATALADANNYYSAWRSELLEHSENGGQVVALIPTASVALTIALAEFKAVTDPNITQGSASAVVTGFPTDIPANAIHKGYLETSGIFVAEWPILPTGYSIGYCTQGARPLAMREDVLPQFQGFFNKDRKDQFPYLGEQWIRRAGFAANNRVGALAQITTNGTYTAPTGYSILMAS